jgi:hypothetical protein
MLKINLERLEKMTNHGAEDDPDRKVTGNFALLLLFEKSISAN